MHCIENDKVLNKFSTAEQMFHLLLFLNEMKQDGQVQTAPAPLPVKLKFLVLHNCSKLRSLVLVFV